MSGPEHSDDGAPPPAPRASLFGRRPQPPAEVAAKPPPPTPPRKPRRSLLSSISGFLTFVLIGALIALGALGWGMLQARKPGPLVADKIVNIAREDDGGPIADQLERQGVIESSTWFTLMTLLDGARGGLKRGEYAFRAGQSMRQVEEELVSGKTVLHSLTIPEGLTSDQVAQRVRDNDVLIGDVKEVPREGSILPETYKFARGETRQALLTLMAKSQAKAIDDIWKKRAPDLPIKSPGELVTLASLVEKETGKADERPRVAGVFINRLQRHMRLQSDPTIVYGLVFGKGTLGHPITKAELDQSTPYNTYIIDGLPPGPIANPGKAALEAAANPARTKELYFVADGTGGHAFAETIDQHKLNVAKWRQIEKDAKDKLAPDVAPSGAPAPAQIKGETAAPAPANFGALAPAAAPAGDGGVTARLARIGAARLATDKLMAGGARTLEDVGAVVTGVNDAPEGLAFADDSDPAPPSGPAGTSPMSPARLAELRAREAKYGNAPLANGAAIALPDAAPEPSPAAGGAKRRWVADTSEGTPLDPLLNKTFDLNYAKTVPAMR